MVDLENQLPGSRRLEWDSTHRRNTVTWKRFVGADILTRLHQEHAIFVGDLPELKDGWHLGALPLGQLQKNTRVEGR